MTDPQASPLGGSEIGRSRPRRRTRSFLAGRGDYFDDVTWPRTLHAAFLRSPTAAARIRRLETTEAAGAAGVAAVLTAADLATVCRNWRTTSKAFPGLAAPEQGPLAAERVTSVGEPIALALASTRAAAEDAVERIALELEETPAVARAEDALQPNAPKVHPDLADNLAWRLELAGGEVDKAFAEAALIVSERFSFARHTAASLEPRGLMARYDAAEGRLEVRAPHQVPGQLQLHLAELLDLPMHAVRVVVADVGGGFGVKMHIYPDEIAVAAAAKLLGRPVKFVADRLESMASDAHAREHEIEARLAVDAEGRIRAIEASGLQGIGSHSIFPRSSTMETNSAMRILGAPYALEAAKATVDVVFQNKAMTGQYRSVGHPIGCAVTERLVDLAASARGDDTFTFRRRNFQEPGDGVVVSPLGARMFDLSHGACLDKLEERLDRPALARSIAEERAAGRLIGLGVASFVEMTASGSEGYGAAGVPVSAADSVFASIEPDGTVKATASVAEIGQGVSTGVAQILADALGTTSDGVSVALGDTGAQGHGGGAWASRGISIGGEAVWQAGRKLRRAVLDAAAALLQADADTLDLKGGQITDAHGEARISLAELARTVHFRGHEFPAGTAPQFQIACHYRREKDVAIPTNGAQAALVEIDPGSGIVTCRRHWVVHDCGRVINPLLAAEQIRGGVVQGIGAALFEACRYDGSGGFLDGSFADYLVPMAAEMPDIDVVHVETPYRGSELGAKGCGEAGTCAASGAVMNAVNDALQAAGGGRIATLPMTPQLVLAALDAGAAAP